MQETASEKIEPKILKTKKKHAINLRQKSLNLKFLKQKGNMQ